VPKYFNIEVASMAKPSNQEIEGPANPYTEARREWNERYGSYIARARNWRIMAFLSGLCAILAVGGLVYGASQNRFIPYIVEVDKLGVAAAVGFADRASPVDQRIIKAFLGRLVEDARFVTSDAAAQKAAINRVYSMIAQGTSGLTKFNEYFNQNSPFKRAETETVSVEIVSILPITQDTWQCEWSETARNLQGQIKTRARWKASIAVAFNPPTDEKQILLNPLGIYALDINWTQQL
jgi:type IV secretion system protein VirB5